MPSLPDPMLLQAACPAADAGLRLAVLIVCVVLVAWRVQRGGR